ncbi:MAG: 50S ribosomal protein L4 [Solirubrobacterales bacterium]
MASLTVLGKKSTENAPDEVFGQPFHESLVWETARADLAARRRVTASTLTRGEVAMTTAKAWRQKGTGRARVGALSSPQRTGGGVAFGPRPDRNYKLKVNRKARRKALRSVLSVHAERGSLAVPEDGQLTEPSNKAAAALLDGWDAARPTLVLLDVDQVAALKSFRNLARVRVLPASAADVADVLGAASLIVARSCLEPLAQRAAGETSA